MPFDSEIGPVKLYSPSAPGKPWRVTWTPPGLRHRMIAGIEELIGDSHGVLDYRCKLLSCYCGDHFFGRLLR